MYKNLAATFVVACFVPPAFSHSAAPLKTGLSDVARVSNEGRLHSLKASPVRRDPKSHEGPKRLADGPTFFASTPMSGMDWLVQGAQRRLSS
ncbi:MAG: hypothetical protein M3R45_03710 [Pseudomonadota bacterium]|nr:hypothetical protein [Pseudomonadota bacterium]